MLYHFSYTSNIFHNSLVHDIFCCVDLATGEHKCRHWQQISEWMSYCPVVVLAVPFSPRTFYSKCFRKGTERSLSPLYWKYLYIWVKSSDISSPLAPLYVHPIVDLHLFIKEEDAVHLHHECCNLNLLKCYHLLLCLSAGFEMIPHGRAWWQLKYNIQLCSAV